MSETGPTGPTPEEQDQRQPAEQAEQAPQTNEEAVQESTPSEQTTETLGGNQEAVQGAVEAVRERVDSETSETLETSEEHTAGAPEQRDAAQGETQDQQDADDIAEEEVPSSETQGSGAGDVPAEQSATSQEDTDADVAESEPLSTEEPTTEVVVVTENDESTEPTIHEEASDEEVEEMDLPDMNTGELQRVALDSDLVETQEETLNGQPPQTDEDSTVPESTASGPSETPDNNQEPSEQEAQATAAAIRGVNRTEDDEPQTESQTEPASAPEQQALTARARAFLAEHKKKILGVLGVGLLATLGVVGLQNLPSNDQQSGGKTPAKNDPENRGGEGAPEQSPTRQAGQGTGTPATPTQNPSPNKGGEEAGGEQADRQPEAGAGSTQGPEMTAEQLAAAQAATVLQERMQTIARLETAAQAMNPHNLSAAQCQAEIRFLEENPGHRPGGLSARQAHMLWVQEKNFVEFAANAGAILTRLEAGESISSQAILQQLNPRGWTVEQMEGLRGNPSFEVVGRENTDRFIRQVRTANAIAALGN